MMCHWFELFPGDLMPGFVLGILKMGSWDATAFENGVLS